MYRLILYQDRKKQWRWRLLARNGKIIANAGQGYSRRIDCRLIALKLLQGSLSYTEEA